MDKINFIQPHTANSHHQVRRWYLFSLISFLCCISILGCLQLKQLLKWYSIKKTYLNQHTIMHKFQDLTHKQHILRNKKQQLEHRITAITHLQNKTAAHPFFIFAHIPKKYPELYITSCSVHHKKVTLIMSTLTYAPLEALIKELRTNSLLKNIVLSSITVHKETLQATIHAELCYSPTGTKK